MLARDRPSPDSGAAHMGRVGVQTARRRNEEFELSSPQWRTAKPNSSFLRGEGPPHYCEGRTDTAKRRDERRGGARTDGERNEAVASAGAGVAGACASEDE